MKTKDRIILENVKSACHLTEDEFLEAEADAAVRESLAENKAFDELSSVDVNPPDRHELLEAAYADAGRIQEETAMNPFRSVFSGKKWYVQVAIAAALILFIAMVFTVTPVLEPGEDNKVSLAPAAPALAAQPGCVVNCRLEGDEESAKRAAEEMNLQIKEMMAGKAKEMAELSDELNAQIRELALDQMAWTVISGDGEIARLLDANGKIIEDEENLVIKLENGDFTILKDINFDELNIELEAMLDDLNANIELLGDFQLDEMTDELAIRIVELDKQLAEVKGPADLEIRAEIAEAAIAERLADVERQLSAREAELAERVKEVSVAIEALNAENIEELTSVVELGDDGEYTVTMAVPGVAASELGEVAMTIVVDGEVIDISTKDVMFLVDEAEVFADGMVLKQISADGTKSLDDIEIAVSQVISGDGITMNLGCDVEVEQVGDYMIISLAGGDGGETIVPITDEEGNIMLKVISEAGEDIGGITTKVEVLTPGDLEELESLSEVIDGEIEIMLRELDDDMIVVTEPTIHEVTVDSGEFNVVTDSENAEVEITEENGIRYVTVTVDGVVVHRFTVDANGVVTEITGEAE